MFHGTSVENGVYGPAEDHIYNTDLRIFLLSGPSIINNTVQFAQLSPTYNWILDDTWMNHNLFHEYFEGDRFYSDTDVYIAMGCVDILHAFYSGLEFYFVRECCCMKTYGSASS